MVAEKPSYAELAARVRELEERCSLFSTGMDSFFVEAPAGLAIFDRECRYVRINRTLADFAGRSVAEHLGRPLHEMLLGPVGLEAEAGLRQVLATGEAMTNTEISGELPGQPGVVRHWLHSQFPIRDGQQRIVGVGVIVVETTASRELLAQATRQALFQRLLLENLPQKIFMKDANSTFLYCNAPLARDLGLPPGGVAGKRDEDFFPPEIAAKYQADDRRVMASGKVEELEELYFVEGQQRTIHTTKAPVITAEGEVVGLLGIFYDITARKEAEKAKAQQQAELEKAVAARTAELQLSNEELLKTRAELQQAHDALAWKVAERTKELGATVDNLAEAVARQTQAEAELRESEERLRQIAESISSVVWIRDLLADRILYVNPAYETLWGRSCKSLYEHPGSWLDSLHPEDRERVRTHHIQPRSGPEIMEYRLVRPDGEIRWVRTKVFVVRDLVCEGYREVGIAEDVTAYQEVFERLQESERRYRRLFDSSIDGISISTWTIGEEGGKKLIDCNESYLALAGRSKAELLAAPNLVLFKACHERFQEGVTPDGRLAVPLSERRCRGVYSWQRPNQRRNFIECRGMPVRINGIECMHCLHRDVTTAKEAEEKIRDLSRRLFLVAEEERRRIARDLHDDFGQYLLSMRHSVDILQGRLASAGWPELPEITRIDDLIESLATTVRGATNRLQSDLLDNLGLVPALQEGMKEFANLYPSVRTSVEIVGTPSKSKPEFESVLYRVFQEGLTNIGKHAQAKSVSVRLIFSYPSLILIVADDGVGFDPEVLPVQSRRRQDGIGLRGMQERVLAVGGTLKVRSALEGGTMLRAEVGVEQDISGGR